MFRDGYSASNKNCKTNPRYRDCMAVVLEDPITIAQYLNFEAPEGYRDELIYGRIVNRPGPLQSKVAIYVKHGLEAWVIHPQRQEVKVYVGGDVWTACAVSVLERNGKPVPLKDVFRLP